MLYNAQEIPAKCHENRYILSLEAFAMEKKGKQTTNRLAVSAATLAAALLLWEPAAGALSGVNNQFDWSIPFRLVALIAGLSLAGAVCTLALQRLAPESGHSKTMVTLASSAIRYVLVIAGLLWGLAILGVDVNALLAGAGVVALIIGFGAESLIADVITGIFMLFEHQYEVGDIIVVDDFRGTVTQIGIRTTSITDTGGNVKIINNSDIRNLINRSASNSVAVCDLGVLYDGQAVRKAEEILAAAIDQIFQENPTLFQSVPRYLGVQELNLTENAAILRVVADVSEANIYAAQRVMNRNLMMALEDAGVGNPPAEIVVSSQP